MDEDGEMHQVVWKEEPKRGLLEDVPPRSPLNVFNYEEDSPIEDVLEWFDKTYNE